MSEKTITAGELAELVGGRLAGDAGRVANGVASIRHAGSDKISFIGNKKYEHLLAEAKAGIILVCPELAAEPGENRTLIVCDNVDAAFAKAISCFAPPAQKIALGVAPSAVVDPSVKLGKNVSIGANAVIEYNAEIGDDAVIGAGCYIGPEVKIGPGTKLSPNVTVMYRCEIGAGCIVHPGVVIGGDGFGFMPTKDGLVKIPQTGIVRICNDVEIGANTTIDRARFGVTLIKDNVKIDNLVMIAHNVEIGESSIVIAQAGIAGSAEIGRGVILAAQSGVNGHITIGDGVQLAGTSSAAKSLPPGAIMLGTPCETQREWAARWALPRKVERLQAKLEALQAKLDALENK